MRCVKKKAKCINYSSITVTENSLYQDGARNITEDLPVQYWWRPQCRYGLRTDAFVASRNGSRILPCAPALMRVVAMPVKWDDDLFTTSKAANVRRDRGDEMLKCELIWRSLFLMDAPIPEEKGDPLHFERQLIHKMDTRFKKIDLYIIHYPRVQ